ncbi:hypothetical protein D3C78_1807100 [compost metagenome]
MIGSFNVSVTKRVVLLRNTQPRDRQMNIMLYREVLSFESKASGCERIRFNEKREDVQPVHQNINQSQSVKDPTKRKSPLIRGWSEIYGKGWRRQPW